MIISYRKHNTCGDAAFVVSSLLYTQFLTICLPLLGHKLIAQCEFPCGPPYQCHSSLISVFSIQCLLLQCLLFSWSEWDEPDSQINTAQGRVMLVT